MKLYTSKNETAAGRKIVADDMILTKDLPTTAGSKMLVGYQSLFDAEALTRLYEAGFSLAGKAEVGEFAIDVLGETSHGGRLTKDGALVSAVAEILSSGDAEAAICLDVNGYPRRAAAVSGLVAVKPTYGVVSRYGTVPVACSGECVGVIARCACRAAEVLGVITGHDDKDGTSLPEEKCALAKSSSKAVKKIAVIKEMTEGADKEVLEVVEKFAEKLKKSGVEVEWIDGGVISKSGAVWNVLMSSELCNNVSRYDGVKYGYRSSNFSGIDELYTNSRTEAFGKLLKTAILYGSDNLSTENYMKIYDKSLRMRRVIVERFAEIFAEYDAVLMPATSTLSYTEDMINSDGYISYKENFYTAPASVTGLPAVVSESVQLVGPAFSEGAMLKLLKSLKKEACEK